ncbi:MAG: hypothetical protein ACXVQQ_02545 [Gaiellaceae bacterium]
MLRQRIVLLVVAGAVSFGGGAAYAATHGSAHPAKQPAPKAPRFVSNAHYPCHHHGIPTAQL